MNPQEQEHPSVVSLDRMSIICGCLLLAVIPIRLLSLGYLPVDDALRHAGKALTNRTWAEILVIRPEVTMDSHPGFHALLRMIHAATGADALDLVFVSVVMLFLAVSTAGLSLGRSPVGWMAGVLFMSLFDPDVVLRWIMGRPFLLSTAVLIAIVLGWERGPILTRGREWTVWIAIFSLLSWIHPSFYLFALPVFALAAAGRRGEAFRLASVCLAGSVGASWLSGHPVDFYRQAILHPLFSLGKGATSLVGEFQPADGSPLLVLAAFLLLFSIRKPGETSVDTLRSDPTVLLALTGWTLAFVNKRFWVDWGAPALLILISRQVSSRVGLELQTPRSRFVASLGLGAVLALSICSDRGGRWSRVDGFYAPLAQPSQVGLLPDRGGILYSDSMYVFYSVFARKPEAPFQYVLGFEAGWMKAEDEAVYREALRVGNKALKPWVDKMRPEDRLIIAGSGAGEFPELEWTKATSILWSGRKALTPSGTGPAAAPEGPVRSGLSDPPGRPVRSNSR